ncbi:MAG: hypothetical protein Q4E76_01250 [Tissierellia bacterium]|nr:hypothetical protein [Tissierellia bacterium]
MEFLHMALVLGASSPGGLAVVRDLGRQGIGVVTVDAAPGPLGVSKFVREALLLPPPQRGAELMDALEILAKNYTTEGRRPVLYWTEAPYEDFVLQWHGRLKELFLFPLENGAHQKELKDILKHPAAPEGVDYGEYFVEEVEDALGYPMTLVGEEERTVESEEELVQLIREGPAPRYGRRIIPGGDEGVYTATVYYQGGSLMGFVTAQSLRRRGGWAGEASYLRQRWIPDLVPLIHNHIRATGYSGPAEVIFQIDEFSRRVYLQEIRSLFPQYTELLCSLGFHLPLLYYLDATGQKLPRRYLNRDTHRHWLCLMEDLPNVAAKFSTGNLGLMKYLTDFRFKRVSATFALDDPSPGFSAASHFINGHLKKLWGKIFRR